MRRSPDAKSQTIGRDVLYYGELGAGKLPCEPMLVCLSIVSFQIFALIHFPLELVWRIHDSFRFERGEFGKVRPFDEDDRSHMGVSRPEIPHPLVPYFQDIGADALWISLHIAFIKRICGRISSGNKANLCYLERFVPFDRFRAPRAIAKDDVVQSHVRRLPFGPNRDGEYSLPNAALYIRLSAGETAEWVGR